MVLADGKCMCTLYHSVVSRVPITELGFDKEVVSIITSFEAYFV